MGKTVKIPNPVYERVSRKAEKEDISRGEVIREWMNEVDRIEERGEK